MLSNAQVSGQHPALFTNKNNGYQSGIGKLPVEDGDLIGRIQLRGWVPGNYYHTGVEIRSVVTGPVMNDGYPANLLLRTGYPTLQTRVAITAEGLVGIGTLLPGYNLHTVGNTHTTGDFFGRIHFDDNQFADDPPNSYIDEAYFELKQRATLNLPAGLGTHGGLLSLAPGASSFDHQLFFAEDGIFTRRIDGNAGSWAGATWHKVLTGEDINGTPNRIAKFTGPNSLGNSQLWDDGTNIGIGTDSPDASFLLDINGTTRLGGNISVAGTANITGATAVGGLLTVNDNAIVTGNLTVNTNSNIDGNLDVTGTTHLEGTVSIATTSTPGGHELYVGGSIIAEEVVVKLEPNWPDYVFEDNYRTPDLQEWEQFINKHKHLPGMPSAEEIAAQGGVALGETERLLVEKVEQLTLLLIQQQKEIKALRKELEAQKTHHCPTQK